jgi:hypothetical protein
MRAVQGGSNVYHPENLLLTCRRPGASIRGDESQDSTSQKGRHVGACASGHRTAARCSARITSQPALRLGKAAGPASGTRGFPDRAAKRRPAMRAQEIRGCIGLRAVSWTWIEAATCPVDWTRIEAGTSPVNWIGIEARACETPRPTPDESVAVRMQTENPSRLLMPAAIEDSSV